MLEVMEVTEDTTTPMAKSKMTLIPWPEHSIGRIPEIVQKVVEPPIVHLV
jgi:hypothetical protein